MTKPSDIRRNTWRGIIVSLDRTERAPDHVLQDRDHRLSLQPASLTAAILGDPPPGYSAAERKLVGENEAPLAPHPIDLLSYRRLTLRRKTGARYG